MAATHPLADLLKARRQELGIGLQQVCDRLETRGHETAPSTVSRWESGQQPNRKVLGAIAYAYHIPRRQIDKAWVEQQSV